MENTNTEVSAQVSTEVREEVKSKTSYQEQVLMHEDENGNSFKYKTMPNHPLTWVQELERSFAC